MTERLTADTLILPLFHQMTEDEQDLIVSVIHAAAGLRQPGEHDRRAPATPGHPGW